MIPTLKYIWLTIKHKYFVFLAGLKTRAPFWLLIIHDWTKFTPTEAPYYGRQFFGKADDPLGFSKAWNHHQKSNKHHWEYWFTITGHSRGGYPDLTPLPMPERYIREMVADWLGASRAYERQWPKSLSTWKWYSQNFHLIKLHPETREHCNKILNKILASN